jgi:hypothetical protein
MYREGTKLKMKIMFLEKMIFIFIKVRYTAKTFGNWPLSARPLPIVIFAFKRPARGM